MPNKSKFHKKKRGTKSLNRRRNRLKTLKRKKQIKRNKHLRQITQFGGSVATDTENIRKGKQVFKNIRRALKGLFYKKRQPQPQPVVLLKKGQPNVSPSARSADSPASPDASIDASDLKGRMEVSGKPESPEAPGMFMKAIMKRVAEKNQAAAAEAKNPKITFLSKLTLTKLRAVCLVTFSSTGDVKFKELVLKYGLDDTYMENIKTEAQNYDQLHKDLKTKALRNHILGYYGYGEARPTETAQKQQINIEKGLGATRAALGKQPLAQSAHSEYSFKVNIPEEVNVNLRFEKGTIVDKHFYLFLEYNPNYKTIKETFDIIDSGSLPLLKKNEKKQAVYCAVWESIGMLHSKCGFVHADLKHDNVMIDISTLSSFIQVKNFDFDLSFFSSELFADELQTFRADPDANPAKSRMKYYGGYSVAPAVANDPNWGLPVNSKANTNDFWWPPFLTECLKLQLVNTDKYKRKIVFHYPDFSPQPSSTVMKAFIKYYLLVFDLWRLYLGFLLPATDEAFAIPPDKAFAIPPDKAFAEKIDARLSESTNLTRNPDGQSMKITMAKMHEFYKQLIHTDIQSGTVDADAAYDAGFNGHWNNFDNISNLGLSMKQGN